MNPRQLGQYADEAGDAVRQTIRAYHGSPYDFDRFDASKIGTGEGAQAYGHGLYFAGSEDVARSYRDSLKDMVDLPVPDELDGQLMQVISEIGQLAGQRGKFVGGEWDAIQKQLDQKQNLLIELQHQYRSAARNPGHMYEVEIGHPGEALLDLDSPATGDHKAALLGAAFEAPENKWQRMAIKEIADRNTRSKVATESLLRAYNSTADNPMLHRAASAAKVADSLFRNGIPGARYFDGASRSAGHGTRNYVMFPGAEDSIRILRKYAIPGAVGTGVASQYEEER